MAIRFFYLPRGKQFNYVPRYYDERKERLEQRKKAIDQELALERGEKPGKYVSNIRGQMRGYIKKAKRQKRQSNIRLLIILLFLFGLTYFIFIF
jgi:hypothetical protein